MNIFHIIQHIRKPKIKWNINFLEMSVFTLYNICKKAGKAIEKYQQWPKCGSKYIFGFECIVSNYPFPGAITRTFEIPYQRLTLVNELGRNTIKILMAARLSKRLHRAYLLHKYGSTGALKYKINL